MRVPLEVIEHRLKGSEIKYGYIWWSKKDDEKFRFLFPKREITIDFLGKKLAKKVESERRRIRIGQELMRGLVRENDILIISKDGNGDMSVRKTVKPKEAKTGNAKEKEYKQPMSFGPLKAVQGEESKVVEEDWGSLKPTVAKKKLKEGDRVGKHGIFMGERGIYDQRNELNELTGREWALFTKSWFIHNPPARTKKEVLHPAKFPESMIVDFIKFFTKKDELVLDPMLGTGSTLVACDKTHRRGVGIELIKKWANIAKNRTRQLVIEGDARNLKALLAQHNIHKVDFCITSPPYWNMLKKSRGHVFSLQKRRKAMGLDEYYSEEPNDFGNIDEYEGYLDSLYGLFSQVHEVLRPGRYLVVIVQNILTPEGEMAPVAWDLGRRLSNLYILKQERLWLQDNKLLGIWGYPFRYVSNVHHHYCLIFEKIADS